MKKITVAVIGVGRFGYSICKELSHLGADVVAVDKNEEVINSVKNMTNNAIICDSTKSHNLIDIGINNIDYVIVGIGKDIEASIMTTLILNDLGVKNILVKVENEYHAKIVERLGAVELIRPEETIGKRTARRLLFNKINDYIDLTQDVGIVEIKVTDKLTNIPLMDLDFRNKYSINITAVRRGDKIKIPKATDIFIDEDILIIIGENKYIKKFTDLIK